MEEQNLQQNYEELIAQAYASYQAMRLDEALKGYRAAAALQKNCYEAQVGIAQTLARMRRQDEAYEAAEQAVALDAGRAEGYATLGVLHFLADRLEEAIIDLQKAIQLAPNSIEPRLTLSQVYADRRQFEDARAEVGATRDLLENIPDEKQRQQFLASVLNAETYIYLAESKNREAIESAQKVIALEEANPYAATLAYSNLGILEMRTRHFDEAIDYLEHAYQMNPYLYRIGGALGRLLIMRSKPDRAAEVLAHTVETMPAGEALTRYYYGVALARSGQRALAREQHRQALGEGLKGIEALNARWQLVWLSTVGRYIVLAAVAAVVVAWLLLAKPSTEIITFALLLVVILVLQQTFGRRKR